jgi:GYF domain 2
MNATWFYLNEANESIGPVTPEDIQSLRKRRDPLIWCEGMSEWKLASALLPALAKPRHYTGQLPPVAPIVQAAPVDNSVIKLMAFEANKKSVGVALILQLLIPSAGYFYVGRWGGGLCFLFLGGILLIATLFTFGIAAPLLGILWLLGIIDVCMGVSAQHRKLLKQLTKA